jgi:uncharacterized membrane protein
LIPALLLIPLLRYASVHWLPAMFASQDVAGAVTDYMVWRVFGLLFAFTNVMFRAFYIGIARTKVLPINAVVMGLVIGVRLWANLWKSGYAGNGHGRSSYCFSDSRDGLHNLFHPLYT